MTSQILPQSGNLFSSSNEDSSKSSNELAIMPSHTDAITMTSIELVEYINTDRKEKALAAMAGFPSKGFAKLEHADFLKKVPEVLGEVAGNFSGYYTASNGKANPCYYFPKREACLMAMSYSYELQAKVFDKMTALEAKAPAFAIPTSLSAALRLAADQSEQIERQNAQLAVAAPKAAALDLISAGKDAITITEASKVLGMKRKDLTAYLHKTGWIYRQNGSWVAYDQSIKNGCLQYKEATYTDEKTGMECKKPYCHITPKGITKLALMQ